MKIFIRGLSPQLISEGLNGSTPPIRLSDVPKPGFTEAWTSRSEVSKDALRFWIRAYSEIDSALGVRHGLAFSSRGEARCLSPHDYGWSMGSPYSVWLEVPVTCEYTAMVCGKHSQNIQLMASLPEEDRNGNKQVVAASIFQKKWGFKIEVFMVNSTFVETVRLSDRESLMLAIHQATVRFEHLNKDIIDPNARFLPQVKIDWDNTKTS